MWQRKVEKKIDKILLEARLISKEQLDDALGRQQKNGQSLTRNLVDLGYVKEDKIAQYIAEQYRLPYLSLDRYKVDKNLFHIVPQSISDVYGVIPIDLIGDILTVGIVDAPDKEIIKRIQESTGFKIQIIVITSSDFNQYMESAYNLSFADKDKIFLELKRGTYIKTPLYNGRERRRFRRFIDELKIKYEFRNEYNINSSLNVSRGGILVKSKSPLPLNSHVVMRMEIPNWYDDVIIISRVVRVEERRGNNYFIALEFNSMDAMDSKKLSEFLKSLNE